MATPAYFEKLICEALYYLAGTAGVQSDTIAGRAHNFRLTYDDSLVFFKWDFPTLSGLTITIKASAYRCYAEQSGYYLKQTSIYSIELNGLQVATAANLPDLPSALRGNLEQGGHDLVCFAALQEETAGYWSDLVATYNGWTQYQAQSVEALDTH